MTLVEKILREAEEPLPNFEYLYHATTEENFGSIMVEGIKAGFEGGVYLADSYQNAAKFLVFRRGTIYIFQIIMSKLKRSKLQESFDHDEDFFKCKAYFYNGSIPATALNKKEIKMVER